MVEVRYRGGGKRGEKVEEGLTRRDGSKKYLQDSQKKGKKGRL